MYHFYLRFHSRRATRSSFSGSGKDFLLSLNIGNLNSDETSRVMNGLTAKQADSSGRNKPCDLSVLV